ncbi:uncharacterized protein VSU04_004017 [Chlamydotis macqueenii]
MEGQSWGLPCVDYLVCLSQLPGVDYRLRVIPGSRVRMLVCRAPVAHAHCSALLLAGTVFGLRMQVHSPSQQLPPAAGQREPSLPLRVRKDPSLYSSAGQTASAHCTVCTWNLKHGGGQPSGRSYRRGEKQKAASGLSDSPSSAGSESCAHRCFFLVFPFVPFCILLFFSLQFLWSVFWRLFPPCACTCCSESLPSCLSPPFPFLLYPFVLLGVAVFLPFCLSLHPVHLLLSLGLHAVPWLFFIKFICLCSSFKIYLYLSNPCGSHKCMLSLFQCFFFFLSVSLSCSLSCRFLLYPFVPILAHIHVLLCPAVYPRFFSHPHLHLAAAIFFLCLLPCPSFCLFSLVSVSPPPFCPDLTPIPIYFPLFVLFLCFLPLYCLFVSFSVPFALLSFLTVLPCTAGCLFFPFSFPHYFFSFLVSLSHCLSQLIFPPELSCSLSFYSLSVILCCSPWLFSNFSVSVLQAIALSRALLFVFSSLQVCPAARRSRTQLTNCGRQPSDWSSRKGREKEKEASELADSERCEAALRTGVSVPVQGCCRLHLAQVCRGAFVLIVTAARAKRQDRGRTLTGCGGEPPQLKPERPEKDH